MSKVIQLTDKNFEENVIRSEKFVLVDFWADWCTPCKMLSPILDEIASNYEKNLSVGKLNIDQNSLNPKKYAVRSIPTLLLFKEGVVLSKKVGLFSKSQLEKVLHEFLV